VLIDTDQTEPILVAAEEYDGGAPSPSGGSPTDDPNYRHFALRRVLDSRGNPTVEADVLTESGGFGRGGSAQRGRPTGEYEAIELPANESIAKAREHAVPRLEGVYAGDQRAVDNARARRRRDG